MGGGPASLAVAAGAVWVANQDAGTVSCIDPANNRVTATWPVGPGSGGLLVAQGALWLSQDDGTVLRVDAATGKQVARVRVASGVGRTGPARRVTPLLGLTPGGA